MNDDDMASLQALDEAYRTASPEERLAAQVGWAVRRYLDEQDPKEDEAIALTRELRSYGWTTDDIRTALAELLRQPPRDPDHRGATEHHPTDQRRGDGEP